MRVLLSAALLSLVTSIAAADELRSFLGDDAFFLLQPNSPFTGSNASNLIQGSSHGAQLLQKRQQCNDAGYGPCPSTHLSL